MGIYNGPALGDILSQMLDWILELLNIPNYGILKFRVIGLGDSLDCIVLPFLLLHLLAYHIHNIGNRSELNPGIIGS